MKNKKNLIIIILLILIFGVILFLFLNNKKYDVSFALNGEDHLIIDYGTNYSDPGFVAKNGLGQDISSSVIVTGMVNNLSLGDYEIIYELSYGKVKKELSRIITVDLIDINHKF